MKQLITAITLASMLFLASCSLCAHNQTNGAQQTQLPILVKGPVPANTIQIIYYDTEREVIRLVPVLGESWPDTPLQGHPNLYEAALFSCNEIDEAIITDGLTLAELTEAGLYIGWLQWRSGASEIDPTFNPEIFCRPLGSKQWLHAASDEWLHIQDKISRRCPGGQYAYACYAPATK